MFPGTPGLGPQIDLLTREIPITLVPSLGASTRVRFLTAADKRNLAAETELLYKHALNQKI